MTVNVALLGSGVFASNAYLPALLLPENSHINLHTLWSRSEQSVRKLADTAKTKSDGRLSPRVLFGDEGFQTLLDDKHIDGVMLVLPVTTQMALIPKLWAAGKHVLSEKPMAKDVASGRALVEEYEKVYKPKGLVWRVAEDYDYEPLLIKAGKILKDPSLGLGPVMYWNATSQVHVADGSLYHATTWRTVPDYQGGFLLDGGVHNAALIRRVIPAPPEEIISTAALHRNHLVPHDTVQAIALSPSTTTEAHGPGSTVQGIRTVKDLTNGVGKSTANGTIVFSVANPDVDGVHRVHNGLTITCLNAIVKVINLQTGSTKVGKASAGWKIEIIPGKGTNVTAYEEQVEKTGVRDECSLFAHAIASSKAGKPIGEVDLGEPRNGLWDVALLEALLTSNGDRINIQKIITG